jgi:hypothetical protein
MNPWLGWALAALFVALAWQGYGWPGVAFAASAIVFWLLLQFNRALRVMKNAGAAPIGQVDNAVMLNARLKTGMTLLQVSALTHSLGRRVSDAPEVWGWADAAGDGVTLHFERARLARWELVRASPEGAIPDT